MLDMGIALLRVPVRIVTTRQISTQMDITKVKVNRPKARAKVAKERKEKAKAAKVRKAKAKVVKARDTKEESKLST